MILKYTDFDNKIVTFFTKVFWWIFTPLHPDAKSAFLGLNVWLNQEDKEEVNKSAEKGKKEGKKSDFPNFYGETDL